MKLYDNLMLCTKDDLLIFAKNLNVKGRSKMNKAQLSEAVSEILLSEEHISKFVQTLTESDMKTLKNFYDGNADNSSLLTLHSLLSKGYAFFKKDAVSLCDEFKEIFEKCNNADFNGDVEMRTKVIKYCRVLTELYGIAPIKKIYEIYDKQNHDLSQEQFADIINMFVKEGTLEICNEALIDPFVTENNIYDALLKIQEAKPFYIPSRKKIMKMAEPDYVNETNEYIALREYLLKRTNATEVTAENAALHFAFKCSVLYDSLPDIQDILNIYGIKADKKQNLRISQLVEALSVNTRRMFNRGYTDMELNEVMARRASLESRFDYFL